MLAKDNPLAEHAPTIGADGTVGGKRLRWTLAEEVPAALLYNGESFAVMMVTPQDLEDFARGFSLTEGIVEHAGDIRDIRITEALDGFLINMVVDAAALQRAEARRRKIPGRTGCGVCGTQSLGAAVPVPPRVRGIRPDDTVVLNAFAAFRDHQPLNQQTHSLHAAAYCAPDGRIELAREDIGRHNALDKLAGALAREGRDASAGFIVLSSRLSVEMVYKAAAIGAPFVASISAPTGLALRLAAQAGMGVGALYKNALMRFDQPTS